MAAGAGVISAVDAPLATIVIDRPSRRNALDRPALRALVDAIAAADADPRVAAIVVTGIDPAFCAGVDLKADPAAGVVASPLEGEPWPHRSTVLIAAVNGPAVTGGLELVLACDFAIASDRASFADTHVGLGSFPFWGLTARLPRAVGAARARQMCLTGEFIDAATALQWGLVNEVVPHEDLLKRASELARGVAAADPGARLAMFERLRDRLDDDLMAERAVALEWHAQLPPDHWNRTR